MIKSNMFDQEQEVVLNRFELVDEVLDEIKPRILNLSKIKSEISGIFGKGILIEKCSYTTGVIEDRVIVEIFINKQEFNEVYDNVKFHNCFVITNDCGSDTVMYFKCDTSMYPIFTKSILRELAIKFSISVLYFKTLGNDITLVQ